LRGSKKIKGLIIYKVQTGLSNGYRANVRRYPKRTSITKGNLLIIILLKERFFMFIPKLNIPKANIKVDIIMKKSEKIYDNANIADKNTKKISFQILDVKAISIDEKYHKKKYLGIIWKSGIENKPE
jgi:hypothetical protein